MAPEAKTVRHERARGRWYNSLTFRMYFRFVLLFVVMVGASFVMVLSAGRAILRDDALQYGEQTGNRLVAELAHRAALAEVFAESLSQIGQYLNTRPEQAARAVDELLQTRDLARFFASGGVWLADGDHYYQWRPGGLDADTPDARTGYGDYRELEWFAAVENIEGQAKPYWALPTLDPVTGEPVATCSMPIRREGEFVGVATMSIRLTAVDDLIRTCFRESPGYVLTLDRNNRMLLWPVGLMPQPLEDELPAFPDIARLAERFPSLRRIAEVVADVNDTLVARVRWRRQEGQADLKAVFERMNVEAPERVAEITHAMLLDVFGDEAQATHQVREEKVSREPTLDETAVVSVFHVPNMYWKIVLVSPRTVLTQTARGAAQRVLSSLVFIMVAPFIVMLLLLRRDLIGPMRHMRRYLMGLSETEGDFLQGLGSSAPNELVELAYAFNRRTEKLRETNVKLQKEIEVREQTEQALRLSEARFRDVLENTRDMLYKLNLRTKQYEYISPAAYSVTGFYPEQFVELGLDAISERVHEVDRPRVLAHFRMLSDMTGKESVSGQIEYRWKAKGGAYIWASENRTLVRDEDGKPVAIVASMRDVTERKHVEDEMTRMRHYLRNIIDSMPSVIAGVDTEGRVTLWNNEAARLTGLSPEEAQNLPFKEACRFLARANQTGDAEASIQEKIDRALEDHEVMATERFTVEGPEGQTRYYDASIYSLASDGHEGAVIRIDDVSERVQIEEMMVQTEKMMSVGGLAAGMAHEINNPLGGILQACQNIQRRTSPELSKNQKVAESLGISVDIIDAYMKERGIDEFIQGIHADGVRAAKIVADMLAFSRRSESHFAPVKVEEMIETVLRLAANDYDLKKHYDFRQIKIEREYSDETLEVRCDKTQIEQVLLNLIKNAAQAMGEDKQENEPTITLRTARENGSARIEVIDNGPGMSEQVRRRVFEPFFTTKEVGVGTGLGLSVSFFIITKHHSGTMNVESSLGQGTRFIITLPLDVET